MLSRMMGLLVIVCLLALLGATGCSALNKPPIESFADKLADQAIIPAVKQGLAQGVEQLSIQAGAQGINPTYVVKFTGKWVTGIEGEASVGVQGIAGQLQVSSASSDKTKSSPHARTPASETALREDETNVASTRPAGATP